MKIKVYDPKKKKEIFAGTYENGKFVKEVKPNHYMVKEQGYGIQEDVVPMLDRLGCEEIILRAKTKDFKSKFRDWLEHGKVSNYGHGNQRFLKKDYYV